MSDINVNVVMIVLAEYVVKAHLLEDANEQLTKQLAEVRAENETLKAEHDSHQVER